MNQPSQSKPTREKIGYGAVITLSALVLLLSAVGVVGAWVLQGRLSDTTLGLLDTAEDVASRAQQVIGQVEEPLGEIQAISTNVAEVSARLSQNVEDEGLLKLLLPPEQEQKLVNLATRVQETLATIHEVLATAADLYETIDRIPLINLPIPGLDKIRTAEQTVTEIRIAIEELKGKVAEFRAGAVEKIGVVTEIATTISERSAQVLENLAALDAELQGFKQTLASVRSAVPTAFVILAVLISLSLAYIAYTQVVVIRLFLERWRALQPADSSLPPETPAISEPALPVEETRTPLEEAKPAPDEAGKGEPQI